MKRIIHTELKNTLYILLGLLCSSAAFIMYLIPNNIAAGGFTGIGQLVNSLFPGIKVGTVSILLNIPLFALSMKSLGLRFGVRSLLAMLGLSLFIDYIPLPTATDDLLLATVFGGVIGGIGFGLVLRGSATTGGSDMLAALIHRYFPVIKISVGIFTVDAAVIIASAFVFDQQSAMYALICTFLMNFVVDLVLEGPNGAHSFFVISDHSDEIARHILFDLERGVTALDATGMYSGTEKKVLLCVVNRFETVRLRQVVFAVDPDAFVISNKVHEVIGEGFKSNKLN